MNPTWLKELPDGRHALYLDNLLLSSYVECERKFQYRHIDNIVPKGSGDRTASMWLGLWWASVMEIFYEDMMHYQRSDPGSIEPSEHTIVHAAADAWCKQNMIGGADSFRDLYTKIYDKFRGEEGAARMALDYWKHFGENDTRNWRVIAVELAFGLDNEVLVAEDNELVLYWCGKPDLVVFEQQLDNLLPVETKTEEYLKSNFIQKWKPHSQTAGYILGLNELSTKLGFNRTVDRCVINGAARMVAERPRDGKERPRFLRPRPHYNPDEIFEWRQNTFAKAKRLLRSYLDERWIRADAHICHLYSGCPYRGLDDQPPGYAREAVRSTSYVEIKAWIPYQKETEEETTNA
jgi:hypothetical protein